MPRSPIEKKRRNYNNGESTKPSHFYERNGVKCSAPKRRKVKAKVGWR